MITRNNMLASSAYHDTKLGHKLEKIAVVAKMKNDKSNDGEALESKTR